MADGIFFETVSAIDCEPLVVIIRGRDSVEKYLNVQARIETHRARLGSSLGRLIFEHRLTSAAVKGCKLQAPAGCTYPTGFNAKTGAMIQSYIMRSDIDPQEAARIGSDKSACGDCGHRPFLIKQAIERGEDPEATCYVNLAHGPRVCFEAYKRGSYRQATLAEAAEYVAGLPLRIGSYGDPGAPIDADAIWHRLAAVASERTGYTHRWQDTGAGLKGICMASVDSVDERDTAMSIGWASFRVASTVEDARDRIRGEAQCPASVEAGHKVTCSTCPFKCDGETGGRVIIDHGPGGVGRAMGRKLSNA
jgi:hypothetical protein